MPVYSKLLLFFVIILVPYVLYMTELHYLYCNVNCIESYLINFHLYHSLHFCVLTNWKECDFFSSFSIPYCLTALGLPWFHLLQSSNCLYAIHISLFFLRFFFPLVMLPLSAVIFYPLPSIPHVQIVWTVLYIYTIVLIHL